MFRFIRNFFFPQQTPQLQPTQEEGQEANNRGSEIVQKVALDSSRKRKAVEENLSLVANSKRNCPSADSLGTWNLDIEQANFYFSKETRAIFAGAGNTSLISRQSCAGQFRQSLSQQQHLHQQPIAAYSFASSSSGRHRRRSQQQGWRTTSAAADNSAAGAGLAQSVLGQITNLPDYYLSAPSSPPPVRSSQFSAANPIATAPFLAAQPVPVPSAAQEQSQQRQQQQCIHSTPLTAGMASSSRPDIAKSAASTVPKSSTTANSAAAPSRPSANADHQTQQDDDEDCVITSIEEPKSVADIFSPCKYLSPDWLSDIKHSSQSLKSYMQRVETEENLKMQYWAKRREADERDLVARVTRNLKLAERELPVLPYQYEEPPPTPPIEETEAEEEEFPDLTEAQLQLVDQAWSRQLPGSEVLAEGFSLRVTREELRSLAGLNWLNDNVVNFYMQLIAARAADKQQQQRPGLPKVHAFSTFFYTKLSSSGYASVRRWTRKVDIFSCDVLLCPVHLHNNHWTLCIVDFRSRHIIYLDSLSMGGGASCLPLMRQYLSDEHRDKKSDAELPGLSEYQLVRETGAPQQENGSDCGVFTCKFADYYCKQREFTFTQANMPYFRKRITVEIIEKRLLW